MGVEGGGGEGEEEDEKEPKNLRVSGRDWE